MNPVEFGWNSVDSVLMPNKCIVTLPWMYTTEIFLVPARNAQENVSVASLVLHAQYFASATKKNVVPVFTHRLSWTLVRQVNMNVFSEPNFSLYGQNPLTNTGKRVSEKTCRFAYFTQCDVFHLLAQKLTHY